MQEKIPQSMHAVVLTGNGGFEKLVYRRDVPVPEPEPNEVLIQVGAAGIKVKLTGLFGLHDLYALIAIPATAGMTRADRSQLEQLLAPLARTGLEHKFQAVNDLFERHITGVVFDRLKTAQGNVGALLKELHETTAAHGSSSTT